MIELVEGKKHQVIKRNGEIEPYSPEKLRKVLQWAVTHTNDVSDDLVDVMVDEVLNGLNIKIHDKITIQKLFDEVISTVANKISEVQPIWDSVGRNLYIQKIYKEVWGIKRNEYPDYIEVLRKGIQYKTYNKDVIDTFSDEELQELGAYIKPERDFMFTFGGINLFMDKYSMRYTKTKHLELPQHVYMRVAIQLHYKDKERIANIKQKYDMMSRHQVAVATPLMLNSLSPIFNATSCVLISVDDDSESLLEMLRSSAIYSKNGSGLGIDMSALRAVGSLIGSSGESSGEIPFIKTEEAVVSAWNQKSARAGSAAIYFPWWHYEAPELIMLKDAGGTEDTRARKLKYAIKWNRLLSEKIINDETVYLFDPKDTPELLTTYGEEFNRWYEHYSQKQGIRKRKIGARELAYLFLKVRKETGNIYWFSVDNANEYRMSRDFINQGNLCCAEVMLPTKPLRLKSTQLVTDWNTGTTKEIREYDGEIGICNLTSINLDYWVGLSEDKKYEFMYNLLVGFDNAIEYADYPVKAGEVFNKKHRAIGVGVTNYQYALAKRGIKLTDDEAKRLTHEWLEDILYHALIASTRLAKERGRYEYFDGSRWEQGGLPFDGYELPEHLTFDYKHDWGIVRERIKDYGVRFEFHLATPPGATSSAVLSFTEGIEPIRSFKVNKEGTYNLTFLAPGLPKLRSYYDLAWDIPSKTIIELAAIRQKFIDQGQSLNLYYKDVDSAYELLSDIFYAEQLGIKSLYYMNSQKAELQEECESCAV